MEGASHNKYGILVQTGTQAYIACRGLKILTSRGKNIEADRIGKPIRH